MQTPFFGMLQLDPNNTAVHANYHLYNVILVEAFIPHIRNVIGRKDCAQSIFRWSERFFNTSTDDILD